MAKRLAMMAASQLPFVVVALVVRLVRICSRYVCIGHYSLAGAGAAATNAPLLRTQFVATTSSNIRQDHWRPGLGAAGSRPAGEWSAVIYVAALLIGSGR